MVASLVGKTLGGYKLDEMIGRGQMATVYKGYQTSLNRWVAIKVLYYKEATAMARFQLEAKAFATLRHRNILNIYEYGEEDGVAYIAMEYIRGGTLEDRLNGQPMDWMKAISVAIPLAEALQYAHERDIMHRDVKPSNILMPQEDWPVLADFGLAKFFNQDSKLTKTGTLMGTPNYVAPEQIRNIEVDFRADIYSLGIVIFEMITGRVPFNYKIPNKILLGHVSEPPPAPRTLNPDCPLELEKVILTMLRKNPDDRYEDMQGMIAELKTIQAIHPLGRIPLDPNDTDTAKFPPQPKEEQAKPLGRFFKPFQKILEKGATIPLPGGRGSDSSSSISDDTSARIILQDGSTTITLPDSQKSLILGRTRGNSVADVDLEPHQASKFGVSRRHARLTKKDGTWWLEDLHSLNGTFVNDKEIKQGSPVPLKNGDIVRFSHMTFVFQLS